MSEDAGTPRRFGAMVERVIALATGRAATPDPSAALMRAAERDLIEGPAGPTIPNAFVVAQGSPPEDEDRLRREQRLAEVVALTAVHRGLRYEGPFSVTLEPGGRKAEVTTRVEPGDLPPWGVLTASDGLRRVPVGHNRALVGRSKDADAVIDGDGVSRIHALLWREAGGVWIADLQSANGSYVNGDRVYDVVAVRPGDVVQFGNAGFVFGMA